MSVNSPATKEISEPGLEQNESSNLRPIVVAGLILGLGQAGFFDGIVFHQLLQWHHMFSSIRTDVTVAGMELNTLGDGLFHLLNWLLTLLGIGLLWRAGQTVRNTWSGQAFTGSLLMGAGIFNLVEGIIDHHILGIHHLKPGINQGLWDIGFLASGVLLLGIGLILLQTATTRKEI